MGYWKNPSGQYLCPFPNSVELPASIGHAKYHEYCTDHGFQYWMQFVTMEDEQFITAMFACMLYELDTTQGG